MPVYDFFGKYPCLHDSEIIEITLNRELGFDFSDPSLLGIAFEFLLQYELLRYHIETKPIIGLYYSRLMLGQKKPQLNRKLTYTNRGKENLKN